MAEAVASIRGGFGLGDALYVQAVARHLVLQGRRLTVCTNYPDVYRPLGDAVKIAPYAKAGVDIVAHYSQRKGDRNTSQFEDCCLQAGIKEPAEFRLDWTPTNRALLDRVEAQRRGRKLVLVQMARTPMGRTDGFGAELLPDCTAIQRVIDRIKDRCLMVLVGKGESLHAFDGIEIDLTNQTLVPDLLDLASVADGFLGYVSYFVPLAESLDKPALFVWAARGLKASHEYVRQITPQKVLHRESSRWVFDDAGAEAIDKAADAFLH